MGDIADNCRPNISAAELQRTDVTSVTYNNIYAYSAARLWLAYGLAVISAIIAALIGMFAMFYNGASYSNNFSTILRASHAIELSKDVAPEEKNGSDPLPSYLAGATLTMTHRPVAAVSHGSRMRGLTRDRQQFAEEKRGVETTVSLINETQSGTRWFSLT